MWTDHILFILHQLTDVGCFRLVATVNDAAMNVGGQNF